ncbi:MAG TPA: hypothetical protein VMF61_03815 [Candidatus Acidoferrales bacterium]|nr:hypothetical protein [Candidatus Acidoferrales bacterium]
MTQTAADLEGTFQRAWTLLVANPIVVVPGLIVAAATVMIAFFVFALGLGGVALAGATGSSSAGLAALGIAVVTGIVLIVLAAIVQTAFVTSMAGAAWETGKTTFADGWTALQRSIGEIFLAIVLLALVGIVAAVLAPFTITISLWLYLIFFIYAMPSVIIGGHPASRALSESWRIAARNFWPTVGVAAIVVCVSLIAAVVGAELARIQPFVGTVTSAIVQQAAVAYGTLVIVGEYLKLHAAEPPPAPTAAPPPTA